LNRERRIALAYVLWVVILGFVHSEGVMLFSLFVGLLLGGALRWRILKRTVMVVVLFAGSVSLAYLLASLWMPVHADALILINLRALAITQLSFTLVARVNLHRIAPSHSKIGLLYAMSYAQIMMLRVLFEDYMYGLKSRGATLRGVQKTLGLSPLLASLFATMFKRSDDQVMALRSRGLLDD
jgi:cobalt/nickel transport system permease protein